MKSLTNWWVALCLLLCVTRLMTHSSLRTMVLVVSNCIYYMNQVSIGVLNVDITLTQSVDVRHAENQFSRDHIVIYSGILGSCNTEPLIAAHLAPIIAATVLGHKEESFSWHVMVKEKLIPNALLLLPVTVVFPLSAILTLPVMGTAAGCWYSLNGFDRILDDEADGLALDFLHNAAYDVMDYAEYRVLEAILHDEVLAKYMDIVKGRKSADMKTMHVCYPPYLILWKRNTDQHQQMARDAKLAENVSQQLLQID